jgi:hypothetical protein
MKERMEKYTRTANLFVLIKDQGSGEVNAEGNVLVEDWMNWKLCKQTLQRGWPTTPKWPNAGHPIFILFFKYNFLMFFNLKIFN